MLFAACSMFLSYSLSHVYFSQKFSLFSKKLNKTSFLSVVFFRKSSSRYERIKERDHCDKDFYTMEHLKEIAMYQQRIFQESIIIRNTNISLEDFKTQTQTITRPMLFQLFKATTSNCETINTIHALQISRFFYQHLL